jgi:hypothetical protein
MERGLSQRRNGAKQYTRRESNTVENAGELHEFGENGTQCGTDTHFACHSDADLASLIDRWEHLDGFTRSAILELAGLVPAST